MDRQHFDGHGGEEAEKADTSVIVPLITDAIEASAPAPNAADQIFAALSASERTTLPSPKTRRWTPKSKKAVVFAVEAGKLSVQSACVLYALSTDELDGWRNDLQFFGRTGLQVTRLTARRRLGAYP